MATWGTLTWSTGNFGDQNDSDILVNGISASFDIGTIDSISTVELGWGRDLWGARAWGAPDQIVLLGSFSLTSSLGDETADGEINAGWGRLTWGENAWGEQGDVVLSGISMSASLGDEAISIDVSPVPTSLPMTASQGDESIEISFEIELTGLPFTSNLGIADAGPDAMLQGIGATGSVGNVEAYNLEGWGRYFYGQFVWGATGDWVQVDLTGISLSANLGTADAAPDAEVTGIGFNASLAVGTVVIGEGNVGVTGEAMTASLGASIGFASVETDLTGIAVSANLGNESITGTASVDVNGEAMTAEEGTVDPSPDADVTGIGFNASLAVGTVVIGEANVTVVGEGFAAGLGVGNLDAVTLVDLTGISMSANLGSVTVTAESNVILTGFGLTMAEGTNRTLIWNQVNTGTAATWTEVDTAA